VLAALRQARDGAAHLVVRIQDRQRVAVSIHAPAVDAFAAGVGPAGAGRQARAQLRVRRRQESDPVLHRIAGALQGECDAGERHGVGDGFSQQAGPLRELLGAAG
jgi:hypothetical protein